MWTVNLPTGFGLVIEYDALVCNPTSVVFSQWSIVSFKKNKNKKQPATLSLLFLHSLLFSLSSFFQCIELKDSEVKPIETHSPLLIKAPSPIQI